MENLRYLPCTNAGARQYKEGASEQNNVWAKIWRQKQGWQIQGWNNSGQCTLCQQIKDKESSVKAVLFDFIEKLLGKREYLRACISYLILLEAY